MNKVYYSLLTKFVGHDERRFGPIEDCPGKLEDAQLAFFFVGVIPALLGPGMFLFFTVAKYMQGGF